MSVDPNLDDNVKRITRGFVAEDIAPAISEVAVTKVLYVHQDGNGTNGLTWGAAFTTFQLAYAAASSDANELTLINVGPGTYDVATDPYFTLDKYIHIKGAGQGRTIFHNLSGDGLTDFVFSITEKVKISDCTITNAILGPTSGILIGDADGSYSVIENVTFTPTSTLQMIMLQIGNNSQDYLTIRNCKFFGNDQPFTIGILEQGTEQSIFEKLEFHDLNRAISDDGAGSHNIYKNIRIFSCAIGLDVNSGDESIWEDITIRDCTTGIDIEAAANDQLFKNICYANNTVDVSDNGTNTVWEGTAEVLEDIEDKVDIIDTNVDSILAHTGTTIPGTITTLQTTATAIDALVDLQSQEEQVLFVAKGGDNTNGLSWTTAYTSLASAITAATSTKRCLINLGAGTWDVAVVDGLLVDEPVWIKGAGKGVTILQNLSGLDANDFILNFSEPVKITDCTFTNIGAAIGSGIIINDTNANSSIIERCEFLFESSCKMIHIGQDVKRIHVKDCEFIGDDFAWCVGILEQGDGDSVFENLKIYDCANGIMLDGDSDSDIFKDIFLTSCAIGIDLNSGNDMLFENIRFESCTTNIDDEVGDSVWFNIKADGMTGLLNPADDTGTAEAAGNNAYSAAWTTLLPAVDYLFKVIGVSVMSDVADVHLIKLSADGGTTKFYETVWHAAANTITRMNIPEEFQQIYGMGTVITCDTWAEGGAGATLEIWLHIVKL